MVTRPDRKPLASTDGGNTEQAALRAAFRDTSPSAPAKSRFGYTSACFYQHARQGCSDRFRTVSAPFQRPGPGLHP